MDSYTYEVGKYLGYPECCIKWFSEERIEKPLDQITELTDKQEAVHSGTGFIPCPVCAEKVTKDTLFTLIKDRKCTTSFPNAENFRSIRKKYRDLFTK